MTLPLPHCSAGVGRFRAHNPGARAGELASVPGGFPGFNSGVKLMDLTKMADSTLCGRGVFSWVVSGTLNYNRPPWFDPIMGGLRMQVQCGV